MVIIKCNTLLSAYAFTKTWESFVEMAASGVILLPVGCELVNEVPQDENIVVIGKKEG